MILCSERSMSIHFLNKGRIDLQSYRKKAKQILPENDKEKKVIFLFPGNLSHHKGQTLFSVKKGSGLAIPAADIVNAEFPVLSLPTKYMDNWETEEEQKAYARGAIADLYRAAGAGYHFILPVRPFTRRYFSKPLDIESNLEPAFWGGKVKLTNRPLADYYVNEMHQLNEFLNLSEEQREIICKEEVHTNPFINAYVKGTLSKLGDFKLQGPLGKHQFVKGNYPSEFQKIYNKTISSNHNENGNLIKAKALLKETYTLGSSYNRLLTLTWRNNVPLVDAILQDNKIQSIEDLLAAYNNHKVEKNIKVKANGALAQRMHFIEEHYIEEKLNQLYKKDVKPTP